MSGVETRDSSSENVDRRRFLTVEDGDPRLFGLLQGDSLEAFAGPSQRPMRPLLLQSSPDWTFEFVPLEEIDRPHWVVTWILALRPDTLVLSVGPIAGALGWLLVGARSRNEGIDLVQAFLTIVGVLALHAAVNLFNDYHDHLRGWDRVRERGGARVIGRGWLCARDVHRAAWASLIIAIAVGAWVVLPNFSSGVVLVVFAGVAALEFAVSHFGLKYRGFAEITAWFMFGPLLTGGFVWSMTGHFSWASLLIGMTFGSLALLCLHLKNFERILVDGRAGLKTWTVRTGFDASKKFTYFCLALIVFSMAIFVGLVDPAPERMVPLMGLAFALGPLAHRVSGLESPVAGRLRGLEGAGLRLAWMNLFAFVLGDLVRLFGGLVEYLP